MFEKLTTELTSKMTLDNLKELKSSNPKEYDKTLQAFITATEAATHMLAESKEFRTAFAQIHAEFLKYPESKSIIEQLTQTKQQSTTNN